MSNITIRGKIVPRNLGDPKAIAAQPDTVRKLYLGKIKGVITGLQMRRSADGEPFEGFRGNFMAEPANPDADKIISDSLFVPAGPHGILASALANQNDLGLGVTFAFNVGVMRDTNPQGYTWYFESLFELTSQNIFQNIDRLITEQKQPSVPLLTKEKKQSEK